MLSKEDSRRLAQLERQLRRDDPEFCARMTAGRPAPRRSSFALVFVAVVVWTTALIFGVLAWWIAAGIAAVFATTLVIAMVLRLRPGSGRRFRPGAVPPGW
jgi:Flp pilus assembly protein TadB